MDDRCENKKRRYLAWTTVEQVRVLALDDVEPADTRTDVDTNTLRDLRSDVQSGHLHRFICRRHAQMNEAAHLLNFFFLDEIQRIEIFDFSGDRAREPARVEAGDRGNATLARQKIGPGLRTGVAHRANESQSSNDNPTAQWLLATFRVSIDVIDGVLHRLDLFRFVIGYFDIESFFERHYQLDSIERVGAEVVDERRVGSDFTFVNTELFHDDLLNLLVYCGHSRSSLCGMRLPPLLPPIRHARQRWRSLGSRYCFAILEFFSM